MREIWHKITNVCPDIDEKRGFFKIFSQK
jgi:hypothetical protein